MNFGKGVILKGTVIIIANHGEQIDIPSGAILENKIVSGNLRILDHWKYFYLKLWIVYTIDFNLHEMHLTSTSQKYFLYKKCDF